MNAPNDSDDGWAELARELGLPQAGPATPEAPVAEPPAERADPETDGYAEYADGEPTAEADGFEGEGDEAGDDGPAEAGIPGEPTAEGDEPRKKRRRRRRRRKGPGDETAGPEAAADGEPGDAGEPGDEADAEGEEDAPAGEEAELIDTGDPETASPDATRALIANWDVPSWETIVTTMLHRPQR